MRRLQVPPSQYQFHTSRRSVAAEAHLVVLTFLIVSCMAASAAPVGERASCTPGRSQAMLSAWIHQDVILQTVGTAG